MTPPEPATSPVPDAAPAASLASARRGPSQWRSVLLFVQADLEAIGRSWLCRGFLLASALVTVLELKGMQAEQKVASQMLEAVYVTYLLVWMHGVIFIAGAALAREMDCLNDAILCRGVTRGEYIIGKLAARCLAVFLMIGGVLLPTSFWAIRQDKLVRTEDGFVTSAARNTKVEAWDPKKIFAEVGGTVKEMTLQTADFVRSGDVLAQIDDRAIFDELESERRGEENARNEVNNARRHVEEARRNVAQAEDGLERAERGLIAKDLLSKADQADRQTDIRARKRDLKNAGSQLRVAEEAIPTAERAVENAQARVRDARRRLGHAAGDSASRTTSVTTGWMLLGLGKVIGCSCLLVTMTLTMLMLFRNMLTAILCVIGLWHISNLLFDFAGLKELSYLEMVSTMDKVLGGIAKPVDELTTLAWLFGIAAALGVLAIALFVSRDPPR